MTRPSRIEAAIRRHRLAEVVRRTGITLTADTGSVTVRCPLSSHGHPDRTPSLRLYLDDDRYYCFGCAAKGDVIQWARDTDQLGVAAAIQALDSGRSLTNAWAGLASTAANISNPRPSLSGAPRSLKPGQADTPDLGRTPPERVLAALAAAWGYYTCASLHARASAYLSGRTIDVAVLEAHTGRPETGHTPARADGLVTALHAKGFSDHELVDAGLAHQHAGSGPASDFYRQRVLIPIRDGHQRVVGLIGRNVGDQQRWAKYKNPPRTAVYDKSINLYQPLPAPTHGQGRVTVVEGTLDAMAIAVAVRRSSETTPASAS
ncbi:MAG: CHC2 zinc finger domain-containing protein, partial [Acidimicrobiales bacterium]